MCCDAVYSSVSFFCRNCGLRSAASAARAWVRRFYMYRLCDPLERSTKKANVHARASVHLYKKALKNVKQGTALQTTVPPALAIGHCASALSTTPSSTYPTASARRRAEERARAAAGGRARDGAQRRSLSRIRPIWIRRRGRAPACRRDESAPLPPTAPLHHALHRLRHRDARADAPRPWPQQPPHTRRRARMQVVHGGRVYHGGRDHDEHGRMETPSEAHLMRKAINSH